MDLESCGNEQQIGVLRVARAGLVALNAAAVHPGQVSEGLLGESAVATECGDAVPELVASGEDPGWSGVTASGHSTNRLTLPIMSQYPSGRFSRSLLSIAS